MTLFESPEKGSIVSVTAASGQALEKKKLETYIDEFSTSLNEQLK